MPDNPGGMAAPGRDGALNALRVPGYDFDVPIVINPDDTHRGIVRYEGHYNRPTIYLREWHERVLLHETLHVLVNSDPQRTLTSGTPEEETFVRHLTHLYEIGWRFDPMAAGAQTKPDRAESVIPTEGNNVEQHGPLFQASGGTP